MKDLQTIQSSVIARAKIDPSDTTSIGLILSDANDAIGIVAAQMSFEELWRSASISLALADGDKLYSLAADVDKIETVGISAPTNFAKQLINVPRKNILNITLQKTIGGTSTPTYWYLAMPTIDSVTNTETKNISFDLMPDQAYTILYTYKAYAPLLAAPTSFPFFDPNYHYIIEYYCLWRYAERNPDPTLSPDYFRGEWENGVKELVSNYKMKTIDAVPIGTPIISKGNAPISWRP